MMSSEKTVRFNVNSQTGCSFSSSFTAEFVLYVSMTTWHAQPIRSKSWKWVSSQCIKIRVSLLVILEDPYQGHLRKESGFQHMLTQTNKIFLRSTHHVLHTGSCTQTTLRRDITTTWNPASREVNTRCSRSFTYVGNVSAADGAGFFISPGTVATCLCGMTWDISSINMVWLWMSWSAWQTAGEMPSYCTDLSLFIAGSAWVLKQHRCGI